jgi:hypothetical protein
MILAVIIGALRDQIRKDWFRELPFRQRKRDLLPQILTAVKTTSFNQLFFNWIE